MTPKGFHFPLSLLILLNPQVRFTTVGQVGGGQFFLFVLLVLPEVIDGLVLCLFLDRSNLILGGSSLPLSFHVPLRGRVHLFSILIYL